MVFVLLNEDMDFNTMLISELGPFVYGKTSWLAYQNKLDTFFDEHDVWAHRRRDVCVSMIGAQTLKILKILISPQNIQDIDYETIAQKLESHFYPKLTVGHHIFKFCNRKQRKHESFFRYIVALRKLIVNCGFNDQEDQLKGQIMAGVRDEDLKKAFLEADSQTLTRIFEIGLAYDDARAFKPAPHPRNHKARINRDKTCFRCKESILRKHAILNIDCPFEWAECHHCHVKGHLSIACKYKESVCNYCNQKGHVSRICGKKMEDEKVPQQLSISVTSSTKEDGGKVKVLLVKNLRMNTTENELKNYFEKFGELQSIKMEKDSITNNFNGSATIYYKYAKPYKKVMAVKVHML